MRLEHRTALLTGSTDGIGAAGGGAIVTVGSINGLFGSAGSALYSGRRRVQRSRSHPVGRRRPGSRLSWACRMHGPHRFRLATRIRVKE